MSTEELLRHHCLFRNKGNRSGLTKSMVFSFATPIDNGTSFETLLRNPVLPPPLDTPEQEGRRIATILGEERSVRLIFIRLTRFAGVSMARQILIDVLEDYRRGIVGKTHQGLKRQPGGYYLKLAKESNRLTTTQKTFIFKRKGY